MFLISNHEKCKMRIFFCIYLSRGCNAFFLNSSCATMWGYEEILVLFQGKRLLIWMKSFSCVYIEIPICNCVNFQLESDYSFFHCFLLSEL